MSARAELLLTKTTPSSPRPGRSGDRVADDLQRHAIRRLAAVAWLTLVGQLVVWLAVNLVQGTLADEFATPLQWGFPIGVMVASMGVGLLTRSRRLDPVLIVRLGLVYQVAVSFAIAAGTYYGAFTHVRPDAIRFDRVGLTFVGPWMLIFSILVPAPPREALVGLLASATAVPLSYLAQVPSHLAPALPPSMFALVFVVPYLTVAAMAYVAALIVHRLGVEVRRAYELGSYRLEGLLGRGGMGEVWLASHRMLARPAAIKLIRPESLGGAVDDVSARFEREAQAIASLQSPNTIALYDFGSTEDGTLFYVMELLDGVDLDELVRRHGPLPAERVVHILCQACKSLAEAHARGIIHRDIKPANIYLCRHALQHDVVKVLDFGLAKRLESETRGDDARLTQPEVIAGTPAYLAPEIALGEVVDARADLYALGCVGFWLLTGRLVFEAGTVGALLVAHAHDSPRPPSSLTASPVPDALDQVVLDCLAKDPIGRPQSADALAERLVAVPLAWPWTESFAREWWETNRLSSDAATAGVGNAYGTVDRG